MSYLVELFALIVCMGVFAFHSLVTTLILHRNGGWTVELKEHMVSMLMLSYAMILFDMTSLVFLLYLFTSIISSSIGKDKHLSSSALERKPTEHGGESHSINDVCVEKHKYVAKIIPNNVEVPNVSLENQYDSSLVEHNLGQAETSFYSEHDVHQTELVQPPITTSCSQASQLDKDENLVGISVDTSFIPRTGSMESNEENANVGTGSEDDQMISPSEPLECSTTLPDTMHECKKSTTVKSMGAGDGTGREATSGLSQRARKKLAAILGEFWGLFFNSHGELTEEAKWMRVYLLLDLVLDPSSELKMSTSIAEPSSPKSSLAGDKPPVLSAVPMVSNTSPPIPSVSAELPYLVAMESPFWLSTQQSLNHEPIENLYGYATPSNNGGFGSHGNTDAVGPALAGSYFTNYGNQLSYILVQNEYGSPFNGLYYYIDPHSYHEPSSSGTNFFWNYTPQYGAVCADSLFSVHRCEHWSDTFPYANLQDLNLAPGTEDNHLASAVVSTGAHHEDDSCQSMHDCKTSKTELPEKYQPPSRETLTWGGLSITSETGTPKEFLSFRETDCLLVQSVRLCIRKIMSLEGSGWLFGQNGGCDEELIDCFATTEKLLDNDNPLMGNVAPKSEKGGQTTSLPILPYCGDGCISQARLVVSFAVWCIHRILDLLLVESRPELWGKFTHVLNLLQGILDPAFCKPRQAVFPCKCLEPPEAVSHIKESPGKEAQVTSGSFILELIKDVEISILRRKGQEGTGAANIAFPMGKKNLTSVFRRYKRRLSKSPS